MSGSTKLERLHEPANLAAFKQEVIARWGALDLLDVAKEADLRTGPPLRLFAQITQSHVAVPATAAVRVEA